MAICHAKMFRNEFSLDARMDVSETCLNRQVLALGGDGNFEPKMSRKILRFDSKNRQKSMCDTHKVSAANCCKWGALMHIWVWRENPIGSPQGFAKGSVAFAAVQTELSGQF